MIKRLTSHTPQLLSRAPSLGEDGTYQQQKSIPRLVPHWRVGLFANDHSDHDLYDDVNDDDDDDEENDDDQHYHGGNHRSGRPQPDAREGDEACMAVLNNFYGDGESP